MVNNVFFTPKIKPEKPLNPLVLKINCGYSFKDREVFVSQKLIEGIAGNILEVSKENITYVGKGESAQEWSIVHPHIFVRFMSTKLETYKFFIAESERQRIATYFSLPSPVIKGAFFETIPKNLLGFARGEYLTVRNDGSKNFKSIEDVSIMPCWGELLDPEWHKAFLGWAKGSKDFSLPEPNIISPWKTWPKGWLTFPALRDAVKIGPFLNEAVEGRFVLEQIGQNRLITFEYENGKVEHLLPSLKLIKDKKELSSGFKKEEFSGLFGPDVASGIYNFTKEASKGIVGLCGVNKEPPLKILSSKKVSFTTGVLYYFVATRKGNKVVVKCYEDEELQKFHGGGGFILTNGYPKAYSISLTKDDPLAKS